MQAGAGSRLVPTHVAQVVGPVEQVEQGKVHGVHTPATLKTEAEQAHTNVGSR